MARATAEGAKRETLHSMLRSRPRHRRRRPPSHGQPLRPCAESERALLEQRWAEFSTCPTDRYSHASPGSRGTPPRSCLLSVLCCPAASGAGRTRNWKSAPFAISYCCLRCGKRPQLQIRVRREPRSVRGLFGAVARREIDDRRWRRMQGCAAETLVRWDLEEKDGVTTVRLTRSGLTSESSRARNSSWPLILGVLQAYVEARLRRSPGLLSGDAAQPYSPRLSRWPAARSPRGLERRASRPRQG
jgi:hypothetical protein